MASATHLAIIAFFVARAAAADSVTEARTDYEAGAAAYDRKDWATAAVRFGRADERVPNPRALQLAMASALHLTDASLAMGLVERAEARAVDGSLADLAKRLRVRFGKEVGRVRILCAKECHPTIDGHDVPAPSTQWLTPGVHRVKSTSFVMELLVTGGADLEVTVPAPAPLAEEPPRPAPPPPPPPPPPPSLNPVPPTTEERHGLAPWVFWSGLGVTTTAAAGATFLTVMSNARHDEFLANRNAETAAAGETAQTRATIAWACTGGLLVATVVIAILTDFRGGRR